HGSIDEKTSHDAPSNVTRCSTRGERWLAALGGVAVLGHLLSHGHPHTGLDLLLTGHNETVAGGEAPCDDPVVTEGAIELDAALLDRIVCAHNERRGGAIRCMSDALLGGK